MSEEKKASAGKIVEKKVDYKTGDYLELEFELGDLEFEATGKSKVVENLFIHLLDKIISGELKIRGLEEEEEEEEEGEEEKSKDKEKESEDKEEEEPFSQELLKQRGHFAWELLDSWKTVPGSDNKGHINY